jgi:riboflavin biosynthesis pyrimidine reductase
MRTWAATDGDLLDTYLRPRSPRADRPWVVANMVAGLDGCAARAGRVGELSGPADQELFRRLRQVADVVLVGASTVRLERYGRIRLTDDEVALRVGRGQRPIPRLAVVSRSLAFDWTIPAFAPPDGDHPGDAPDPEAALDTRPLVLTAASAAPEAVAEASRHAEVVVAGDEAVDLAAALAQLHDLGVGTILTEGGPTLLGELASRGLLDELCLTLSPVMGGDPLPVAVWPPAAPTADFRLDTVGSADGHLFLRYLHQDAP